MTNVTSLFTPDLTNTSNRITTTTELPAITSDLTTLTITELPANTTFAYVNTTEQVAVEKNYDDLIAVVWVTSTIVLGVAALIVVMVIGSHLSNYIQRRRLRYIPRDPSTYDVTHPHYRPPSDEEMTLQAITVVNSNAGDHGNAALPYADFDAGSVSMAPWDYLMQDNPGYETDDGHTRKSDVQARRKNAAQRVKKTNRPSKSDKPVSGKTNARSVARTQEQGQGRNVKTKRRTNPASDCSKPVVLEITRF